LKMRQGQHQCAALTSYSPRQRDHLSFSPCSEGLRCSVRGEGDRHLFRIYAIYFGCGLYLPAAMHPARPLPDATPT
jgi:hypothetical protein